MIAQPPQGPVAPSPQEPQWYVSIAGQVFGPANKVTISQWASEGRVNAQAQVAPAGSQQWWPITSVPELRDLQFAGPVYAPVPQSAAPPPTGDEVAPCPHCGGSVINTTGAYGMFFGVMEKSILPRLRCSRCGASVRVDDLAEPHRSKVSRSKRKALIIWLCIVIPSTALIFWLISAWFRGLF